MNSDNSFIEIISLINQNPQAGCVTQKMLDIIAEQNKNNKKTLIFYNRRGTASAWICQDCGFFEKCQNCDIAFSYHNFPKKHLLCHQCNYSQEVTFTCPQCGSYRFSTVGVGIEQIADVLGQETGLKVGVIDSDHIKKTSEALEVMKTSSVILATNFGTLLPMSDVGSIIFALFEVNISVPDYTLEEQIYAQISFFKKQKIPLYIQTFAPKHPLLQELVFGNYKSFLRSLKEERKMFLYPPFVDFVALRVFHRDKLFVQNTIQALMEQIEKIDTSDTFVAYDKQLYEKFRGDFMQKIILKGKNVSDILELLTPFIVKNRYIFVDWQ